MVDVFCFLIAPKKKCYVSEEVSGGHYHLVPVVDGPVITYQLLAAVVYSCFAVWS